jgi:hypothetical protein
LERLKNEEMPIIEGINRRLPTSGGNRIFLTC